MAFVEARGMLPIFARISSRVVACQAPADDKTLSGEEEGALMCETTGKMTDALVPSRGGLKKRVMC